MVDANCARDRSTVSHDGTTLSVPVSSGQAAFALPLPGVGPVNSDQLGVGAPLDDAAGVEDDDLVHGFQSRPTDG